VKIISVDERLAERSGAKVLIIGPSGVGKTSLLKTVGDDLLPTTLFVDIEAGDLAVADLPVAAVRPRTWEDCRDFACLLGGPNPALPSSAPYSQAHFDAVAAIGDAVRLASHQILFIDSITAASRLSFTYAEQQPESFNERGRKDLRSTYGLHGRQMISWLSQLQQARGRHVVLVAILEQVTDEFNHSEWRPQIDGSKTPRELPGIVDQLVTMQCIDFGDGAPVRAFVCRSPNPWLYPAKDRSGKLDQIEEPHLGKLIAKLTAAKEE
jgi:AAA domain